MTGRTEEGHTVTRVLALATRKDVVDAEARVAGRGEGDEVARMLQASHASGGSPPRLGLFVRPEGEGTRAQGEDTNAFVESVLLLDRRLFLTLTVRLTGFDSRGWKLSRARLEPRCGASGHTDVEALSVHVTSSTPEWGRQLHTFSALLPVDAECVALTLEADGPRTLHFRVRLPR